MKKTITLENEQTLTLNNNVGWTLEFRDQFGHDIIPELMPMLAALVEFIGDGIADSSGKIKGKDLLKRIDQQTIENALIQLSSLEFASFINICWAMAKCEDETIDEPKRWIKQFETFPLDIIAPVVLEMIISGVVSSKNFESLREKMESVKAKK